MESQTHPQPGFDITPLTPRWVILIPAVLLLVCFAVMTVHAAWNRTIPRDELPLQATHYRINVNTAEIDELCLLPRVGPSIAQYIHDHRTTHGPFDSVTELNNVRFIGHKTLQRIEPFATVRSSRPATRQAASSRIPDI